MVEYNKENAKFWPDISVRNKEVRLLFLLVVDSFQEDQVQVD